MGIREGTAGVAEVGVAEVSVAEVGVAEVGVAKVGVAKVGVAKGCWKGGTNQRSKVKERGQRENEKIRWGGEQRKAIILEFGIGKKLGISGEVEKIPLKK